MLRNSKSQYFMFGKKRKTLITNNKRCKWPIGDPRHTDFRFCEKKHSHERSPYCKYHTTIAYVKSVKHHSG